MIEVKVLRRNKIELFAECFSKPCASLDVSWFRKIVGRVHYERARAASECIPCEKSYSLISILKLVVLSHVQKHSSPPSQSLTKDFARNVTKIS